MTASLYALRHDRLRLLLSTARLEAALTQNELAARLGKPQSFVSKYERGERRLDVVEFIEVAAALQLDAEQLIRELLGEAPHAP